MHQFTGVLWMSANGRNFNTRRQKAPFLYLPMMSQKQTFTVPLLYTNCCQAMKGGRESLLTPWSFQAGREIWQE